MLQIFEFLKEKVKIGLLTNACDPIEQRERIIKSGLYKFFSTICISGETQKYKPDKEAFEDIITKLSVTPQEAVFVGDSEKYDIEGAKNAGLYAIKKGLPTQPTKADACFSEYSELIGVLSKIHFI